MQVVVFTPAPKVPSKEAFVATSNKKKSTCLTITMEENTTDDLDLLIDSQVSYFSKIIIVKQVKWHVSSVF